LAAEDDRGISVLVTDLQGGKPCEEMLRAEQLAHSILDQAAEAIVVVDRAGKIVHATRVAHRLAGANVLFRNFEEVFPLFTASGLVSAMPIADRRSRMLEGMEASFLRNGADVRQVAVTAGPVRGANREILGDVVTLIDITQRKGTEARMRASLLEKEALLKEVHHRVKNNLQVITSMLNLQAKSVKDPKALEILDESRSRIRSIALIHETLCESADLTKVNMAPYIRSLAGALARAYGDGTLRIALKVDCGAVLLDVGQALPCGLLLNELITNALKHAFPGGRQGEILVGLSEQGGHLALMVADDGIGLPEGVGVHGAETLGLQLVGTFAEQLGGKIEIGGPPGASFRIKFPIAPAEAR
jgi:PAS domain S-box-containing protein